MKKIIIFLMLILLFFTLSSCKDNENSNEMEEIVWTSASGIPIKVNDKGFYMGDKVDKPFSYTQDEQGYLVYFIDDTGKEESVRFNSFNDGDVLCPVSYYNFDIGSIPTRNGRFSANLIKLGASNNVATSYIFNSDGTYSYTNAENIMQTVHGKYQLNNGVMIQEGEKVYNQQKTKSYTYIDENFRWYSLAFVKNIENYICRYEESDRKESTCTEMGIITKKCSICNGITLEVIPAKGHEEGEDGYCKTCNTKIRTLNLSYRYIEETDSYAVSKGTANDSDLVIPDNYKGKYVTEIDNSGFEGYGNGISTLTIPTTIHTIGNDAFKNVGFHYDPIDRKIFYNGTLSDWCKIKLGNSESNPYYKSRTYTKSLLGDNYDAETNTFTIPSDISEIGAYSLYGIGEYVDKITIPFIGKFEDRKTVSLGKGAFGGVVISKIKYPFEYESFIESYEDKFYELEKTEVHCLSGVLYNNNVYELIQIRSDNNLIEKYSLKKHIGTGKTIEMADAFDGIPVTMIDGKLDLTGIMSISIGNNVTEIARYADRTPFADYIGTVAWGDKPKMIELDGFAYYKGREFTIPSSVTKIKNEAFAHASNLQSIVIPDSVTEIGEYAFANCTSLKDISIGEGVRSIGICAFQKTAVSSLVIPNNVTSIGESVLWSCANLQNLTIPFIGSNSTDFIPFVHLFGIRAYDDGTEIIQEVNGQNYFGYVPNVLQTVTVTGSEITPFAFSHCRNLRVIILENTTNIGDGAFSSCDALNEIYIPTTVVKIGNGAFVGCENFTTIYYEGTEEQWKEIDKEIGWDSELGEYSTIYQYRSIFNIKKEGVEIILEKYVGDASEVIIPTYITTIGNGAFYECRGLTSVTIGNGVKSIGESAFYYCTSLTSVVIGNSVESIGNSAFRNCSSLTSVGIPDSVTSIGVYAFGYCTALTNLTIGRGVTNIGPGAFYECGGLTSVIIPDSVTLIGGGAFDYCKAKILWGENPSITKIGEYAFGGYSGTSITIPDSVTSIGEHAFYYCSSLTNITIPDSVTSIGRDAFYGCGSLQYNEYDNGYYLGNENNPYVVLIKAKYTSITSCIIHGKTRIIYSKAFSGCRELTSVTISDSVTSIGMYAFDGCTAKILWGENPGITEIGEIAFSGCSGKSIIIPDSVTSIGRAAFNSCKAEIIWGENPSITEIGEYAFSGYGGTSITIPNSVTSIGSYAFSGCRRITSINIPDGVTNIGESAFESCYKLIEVYNKSSLVLTAGSSDYGSVAYYAKNVYSEEGGSKLSTDSNGYIIYTDGEEKILVGYTGSETNLTLPDGITKINQYAFYYCSGLTSITIPDSVTSIGDSAFRGCSGLTSITIPDSVTSIGEYAFYNCSRLTSINIPDGATSIGSYTFSGCSRLTSVTIGNGVTSIGGEAFNCSGLTNIYYTGDIASWCGINGLGNIMSSSRTLYIGGKRIEGELVIPDSVTSIGAYAFYYCYGLTSVIIGNGVTSIGSSAFYGCTRLTSVTIPNSVWRILGSAFYGCSSLTSITFQGTRKWWNAIEKGYNWENSIGGVYCTDGYIWYRDIY